MMVPYNYFKDVPPTGPQYAAQMQDLPPMQLSQPQAASKSPSMSPEALLAMSKFMKGQQSSPMGAATGENVSPQFLQTAYNPQGSTETGAGLLNEFKGIQPKNLFSLGGWGG